MKPIEKSISDYFREFARDSGNRRFLFDEQRCYTVAEAYHESVAIANQLYCYGVKAGSAAALRCTRSVDTCLIYLALQMIGATAFLTDPHRKVADAETGAAFLISNENGSDDLAANGNWEVMGKGSLPISHRTEAPLFPAATDLHAPATVIFTSGSTGKQKGVILSQYNLVNHIRNFSVIGSYLESDISAEMLPVHHVFGLAVLLMGLIMRYEIFFPKNVTVPYAAQCIETHKITRLDGVPSFALALAEHHKNTRFSADSLRVGVLGGAPSTKAQFDFIERELGIKLLPVYGQSECIGITGADESQSDLVRSSTVGCFLPMNEGRILDENGHEVSAGTEGEICVKGPAVMLGYLGDAQATDEAIDENGFLHTGDLGYLDAGGNLHISGRKKDIIIRNGNNLSARKIEEALQSLPAVSRAAVVGIPHEKYGEVPCALLVAAQPCTESEIRAALDMLLDKNELPEVIRFAPSLPLTSSGKPDKPQIKKWFL